MSTVSPAPALQVRPCPLLVTADLPAHGVARTPLTVRYTVTNSSRHVYSLMMHMDASEGFIFAGNKRVRTPAERWSLLGWDGLSQCQPLVVLVGQV